MKKKGGGRKKVAGVSAKADGSAGTPKKKTTTSAKQKMNNPPELSDIEESPINQCKAPPEGILPSLVPRTRQNTVRSTRNGLPQPPAHVYIPPVDSRAHSSPLFGQPSPIFLLLTIFSLSITRLPTNTHLHPLLPASPANTLEDDDEEEEGVNLKGTFNDLVGEDTSGLNDLSYSSAEDDEDYDNC